MPETTETALAPSGWRPFTIDHLLKNHRIGQWKTITLLAIWIGLIAASMLSVFYMTPDSWVAGNLDRSAIYSFFMLHPPLIIGTLLLFWLGFEWGFIPVFLATFVIAFATDMPFYWAMLFGIAFVLGLGIYALSYYCVPVDKSLRDLKSFAFFVVISCIAAIASSLGSFIWSFVHDMSVAQTMILWRGWWTGVLLQSIFIVGPILFILTPTIEKFKTKWFVQPGPNDVSLNWIHGAILSVAVVLGVFIIGANSLGMQIVDGLVAALPFGSAERILQATESFQVITWISIGLVLIIGMGGIYLVGTWNKSLKEEVELKTSRLKISESELKQSLDDKEILLEGIHDRMRNNLTIILALLELQVKNAGQRKLEDVLRDSHSRLRSLALVHETMYQSKSVDFLNMKMYGIKLANRLHQSHKHRSKEIETTINADEIYVDIDRAMPFAMILNELLENAYLHAFEKDVKGIIHINMDVDERDYIIEIRDDGKGLPDNLDQLEKQHLGLKLVRMLVRQMQGDFEIVDSEKSAFRFTIPVISEKMTHFSNNHARVNNGQKLVH
jgi:two-component sensor histidine kinase